MHAVLTLLNYCYHTSAAQCLAVSHESPWILSDCIPYSIFLPGLALTIELSRLLNKALEWLCCHWHAGVVNESLATHSSIYTFPILYLDCPKLETSICTL